MRMRRHKHPKSFLFNKGIPMSSVINAIGNARSNNVVYLYRKVPVPT